MIDLEAFRIAAARWLDAILADRSWSPILDDLSHAVGAKGAFLVRPSRPHTSFVSSGSFESVRRDYLKGKTPPFPMDAWVTDPRETGFKAHAAPWRIQHFIQFPGYYDYLSPRVGVRFRAQAILNFEVESPVRLMLWRASSAGPFQADELEQLEHMLPSLRAAAALARYKQQVRAQEQARRFQQRGDLVLFFDVDGRVREEDIESIARLPAGVGLVDRRLIVSSSAEQRALDALVVKATSHKREEGAVAISSDNTCGRIFLLVVPLGGEAREVMGDAAAMGVLVDPSLRFKIEPNSLKPMRAAAGLTMREAEVTALLAKGLTAEKIASSAGLGIGTVRNHLKTSMQKFGVHSQVELAAMAMRLM